MVGTGLEPTPECRFGGPGAKAIVLPRWRRVSRRTMQNMESPVAYIWQRFPISHAPSPVRSGTTSQTIACVVDLKPTATLARMTVGSAHVADSDSIRSIVDLVLPPIDEIVAGVPADLVESDEELRARIRLTYANARVLATAGDLDEAIGLLRARASGRPGVRSVDPFGQTVRRRHVRTPCGPG